MQQLSDEWKQARIGHLTASRLNDAFAKTKSGWSASRANLMAALIAERLTGTPMEIYTSAAMIWGSEREAEAVSAYEFYTGAEIQECGFLQHPNIPMAGASPDRVVGEDGLLEVKCPLTATHIETLMSGRIPPKYEPQMMFQMACSGRFWCDFVSYDPRLPERLKIFTKRLPRDQAAISEIEREVRDFLTELSQRIELLEKLDAKEENTLTAVG